MECGIPSSVVCNFYGNLDKNNPPSHDYDHTEEGFFFLSSFFTILEKHMPILPFFNLVESSFYRVLTKTHAYSSFSIWSNHLFIRF